MNIQKITIQGFKAFSKSYEFIPDGRLTIIFGPNGSGKTSLCDAIEWGFLGKLPQYKSVEATLEDTVLNRNNPDREAKVTLGLLDGKQETIIMRVAKSRKVWKPTQSGKLTILKGQDPEVISDTFLATVYLRQEALREFIEEKPEKRRPVLSSLLGLEFLVALERGIDESAELIGSENETLSNSIREKKGELTKYEDEMNSFEKSKSLTKEKWKLSEEELKNELKLSTIISKAKHLFERLKAIGNTFNIELPIDFKEDVSAARILSQKLIETYTDWSSKISHRLVELGEINSRIEGVNKKIAECDEISIKKVVQSIEEEIKKRETELQVKDSYSKVLVSGEEYFRLASPKECPLCDSSIEDSAITLDSIATRKKAMDSGKDIESLLEKIRTLRLKQNEEKAKLDALSSWKAEKAQLEKEFDPETYEKAKQAKKDIDAMHNEALFAIDINNISRKEQELALTYPMLPSEDEIENDEDKLQKSEHLNKLVNVLNEQLKILSPRFVEKSIESLNPTIAEFAKILSPHPTFSKISIEYNDEGYWLKGIGEKNNSTYVQTLFSTAQLNEAAVLILLAMAKMASHQLKFVILDDPSQSLDRDGKKRLADLLVAASKDKQMIVSTMDSEFFGFIKSSCPEAKIFSFSNYKNEQGPVIEK
jgi:recombinational DNA repair ATPase RecF